MKLVIALAALVALAAAMPADVEDVIPGEYIVVMKNPDTALLDAHVETISRASPTFRLMHSYRDLVHFSGYSARMSLRDLREVQRDANVDYVEQNRMMYAFGAKKEGGTCFLQKEAPWGLARIPHATPNLVDEKFRYGDNAGKGIKAYIVDTGVRTTHKDFEDEDGNGRARFGFKAEESWTDTDKNGHGTHVASTVGGTQYGVAKECEIIAVKVLGDNGSGTNAGVIAGVNFVTKDCGKNDRCVANMSLGGGVSSALDDAVNAAVNAGVAFAVAAGNDDGDASKASPARAKDVVTVGATAQGASTARARALSKKSGEGWSFIDSQVDVRSSFSNYGDHVNIFAPGSAILGAWSTSDTSTNTISGTSMASPHVAGAMALYWSNHRDLDAQQVQDIIVGEASEGVISMGCEQKFLGKAACGKSPNRMLHQPCSGEEVLRR